MYAALALIVAGALVALAADRAPAQDNPPPPATFNGSPDEQTACAPDATRYCREDLSDTFRVLACLQQHRQRLRRACREVLEAHGQ
jgi:hypothetical protein